MTPTDLPTRLATEADLDDFLTQPSPELVDFIQTIPGPLVVLGAGGKMGPSLCVRAQRAAEASGHALDVVAVSRFSDPEARRHLEAHGVHTLAADLLDRSAVANLPDASHVVFLVGLKFGTQQDPTRTWAVNTLVPAHACERYSNVPITALSTGNVYPLMPVATGGSVETDPLAPVGEYANACLARERLFDYFSRTQHTPVVLVRLNYAVDLRYGVLVDLARQILDGIPIPLDTGYVNCIWQGDANDMILRSLTLADTPAVPLNLTGPEVLRVRTLAERLAELLVRDVHFTGHERETALLNNPARACTLLGPPPTPIDRVLAWTAEWLRRGQPTYGKPTHFEVRDGSF